jgi:hypothetical protein
MIRNRLLPLIALLAAAALMAPRSAGAQIQGCYVPGSGTVYVIGSPGAPTTCATGHVPVNLQGVQGPPGPSGVATVTTVQMDTTIGNQIGAVTLTCPALTIPLSYGFGMSPMGSIAGIGMVTRNATAYVFNLYNVSNPVVPVAFHLELYCASP